MTSTESAAIAQLVRTIQRQHPRDLISADGELRISLLSLTDYLSSAFLPNLRAAFPAPRHDEIEVAYVALCTLLGPGPESDPVPVEFVAELLALHRTHVITPPGAAIADRTDFVQVCLAYASGWRRTIKVGDPDWDGIPWNGTWVEWNLIIGTHLLAIRRKKLGQSVYGYASSYLHGRKPSVDDPREILGDTQFAAVWFLLNPPVSQPAYLRYTHLEFWKPDIGTLYRWCQIALEGGPTAWSRTHYLTNHFCHGLAFALESGNLHGPGSSLAPQGEVRLEVKPVAQSLCFACGGRSDYTNSTACCPKCGNPLPAVSPEPRLVASVAMQTKDFLAVQESSLSEVRDSDVLDAEALLHDINFAANSVAAHLKTILNGDERESIRLLVEEEESCPPLVRRSILAKLNAFLRLEDLPPVLKDVARRPHTRTLMDLPVRGATAAKRNRLLLEDAFPGLVRPRSNAPDLPDHYIEIGMHPYNHLLSPTRREEARRFLVEHQARPDADPASLRLRARLTGIADGTFKEFLSDHSPINDAPGSIRTTTLWCR